MSSRNVKTVCAVAIAGALALTAFSASAQTVTIGSASVAAGATAAIPVTFVTNAAAPVNSFGVQFTFTRNPVAAATGVATITPGSAGFSCGGNATTNPAGFTLSTAGFDAGGAPAGLPSGTVCTFNIPTAASAPAGNYPFTVTFSEFTSPGGQPVPSGTVINGQITISGVGANTPPTVTPTPAAGSTIVYSGAGVGAPISFQPTGGAGSGVAATTTVGACTISGGGLAFPVTTTNQITFVGATNVAQNITLPNCTPQALAQNATLTCPVTQGAGAAVNSVFTLTCPAAAVGAVPPTITYVPAPGASINVASAAATVIQVGCPTDGAAAVCNGSGVGLGATSRLENLTAVYAGPPFSPTPLMVCAFINEAGALTAGTTLDFVAGQLDAGDIRCTCPTVFVQEPFTVTVRERIPASSPAITATRVFTINCGTGLVCPTLTAAPSSGVVSLVNGGANGLVTTYTVSGIQPGATQTINCVQSGAPAGSTFTVVTNPTPLVLTSAITSGTVSARCTNTNLTTATAVLTCTPVSSAPGCAVAANIFTLSCPGAAAPPTVEILPVPAMGEHSRILLAAFMLLLGLAVIGFRARS